MRSDYDMSRARRGAILPSNSGKTRITIRLDNDVLVYFRGQVEQAGGGSYHARINAALRDHVARQEEPLEELLRRVLREELSTTGEAPEPREG